MALGAWGMGKARIPCTGTSVPLCLVSPTRAPIYLSFTLVVHLLIYLLLHVWLIESFVILQMSPSTDL